MVYFESTPEHALQTLLDIAALLPAVGSIKYIDEAGTVLKTAAKHGDEAADTLDNVRKTYKSANKTRCMTAKEAAKEAKALGFEPTGQFSHGQQIFKKGNRYITPDVDSHNGGTWKMADSIKGLKSKKTRMGTYDAELKRIGD